jgi:hypothetical protein
MHKLFHKNNSDLISHNGLVTFQLMRYSARLLITSVNKRNSLSLGMTFFLLSYKCKNVFQLGRGGGGGVATGKSKRPAVFG